jgi:hypothetical protein
VLPWLEGSLYFCAYFGSNLHCIIYSSLESSTRIGLVSAEQQACGEKKGHAAKRKQLMEAREVKTQGRQNQLCKSRSKVV